MSLFRSILWVAHQHRTSRTGEPTREPIGAPTTKRLNSHTGEPTMKITQEEPTGGHRRQRKRLSATGKEVVRGREGGRSRQEWMAGGYSFWVLCLSLFWMEHVRVRGENEDERTDKTEWTFQVRTQHFWHNEQGKKKLQTRWIGPKLASLL